MTANLSNTWNVIISDILVPPPTVEQKILGARAKINVVGAKHPQQVEPFLRDADIALVWQGLVWNRELLQKLKICKGIVRVGVGYDNIDLNIAKEMGIPVCNVPDYGTNDVADHTMALMLSFARGLEGNQRAVRSEKWEWGLATSFRLTNRKLGIIGLGRIGAAVALRARAFGIQVGFYDPYKPSGWEKSLQLERFFELRDLANWSDIVSLHVPLTEETEEIIGQQFFESCRKGIYLINTARGKVVQWDALKTALDAGILAGYGTDVLPIEPPDMDDSLIKKWKDGDQDLAERLLITPHCAYYSDEAFTELRSKAAEEALRLLKGETPLNRIV